MESSFLLECLKGLSCIFLLDQIKYNIESKEGEDYSYSAWSLMAVTVAVVVTVPVAGGIITPLSPIVPML